jgi:hypothetical protein
VRITLLRAVAGSSLCALALVGTAGAASAGEITGNGKFKPVNGKSICAFSGQNDGYHDPEHQDFPGDNARVQSYGQLVKAGLRGQVPNPGMACNPNNEPPPPPA